MLPSVYYIALPKYVSLVDIITIHFIWIISRFENRPVAIERAKRNAIKNES